MAGYDQKSNVVLSNSKERVFSIEEGVEEADLGLYLVKGDMMYDHPHLFAVSFNNLLHPQHPHRRSRRRYRSSRRSIHNPLRTNRSNTILKNLSSHDAHRITSAVIQPESVLTQEERSCLQHM
jgi:hypothetical protein